MMDQVPIAVVVPSWNGGALTDACVASVQAQAGVHAHVFVVDNASCERERTRLRECYDGVDDIELIFLASNTGYAGGCNAGIERARRAGYRHVAILTQDARLAPGALRALVDAAQACPGAAIVGPIVFDQDTHAETSRGERASIRWICVPRSLLRYRAPRAAPYEVQAIIGCALLLTAVFFDRFDGFDPGFFAYYEEIDLCLRVRQAALGIVCAPAAHVFHRGARGFGGGFTPLSAELKTRNLLYLMRKHARWHEWVFFWPIYLALLLTSSAWYALQGRTDVVRAIGRGLVEGLRGQTGAPPLALRPTA